MEPDRLICIRCERVHLLDHYERACEACMEEGVASNLTVAYADGPTPAIDDIPDLPRSLWRFAPLLPIGAEDAVSLGEGATPLFEIASEQCAALWVKDETRNPTWSFKDRLACVAVSWAKKTGAKVIATSSSGNAGAAAAAYAVRAGLPCVVLTFKGAAGPMVEQIRATGAMVLECETKDDRWRALSAAVESFGWFPTSPFFGPTAGSNPIGIEGYKTIAYEIAEERGWSVPDWCVLPVCYGDALFGLWKGFDEMQRWGWTDKMPKLVAAEVSGSLVAGLTGEDAMPPAIERNAGSVAISIDVPRSTPQALTALKRTDGRAVSLDNETILAARNRLARTEGLFLEASSAAAFAAIDQLADEGAIKPDETVVAVATATGLKDIGIVPEADAATPTVRADLDSLAAALKDHYGFDV